MSLNRDNRTFFNSRYIWLHFSILMGLMEFGCSSTPGKPDRAVEATTSQTKPSGIEKAQAESKDYQQKLSDDAKRGFRDAVALYQQQLSAGNVDYTLLLQRFERVLEHDDNMAEAHYNIGLILENLFKDEKAIEHYKKALELRPDLTLAAANWGALLARHGKLDMALVVYQRALKKDEKNSAVLLNIATIYEQQKKYPQALKTASDVLVRDPQNVGAYRIMASVYYDKGDLDMAHLICLKGLQVKKEDPRLLNTLGLVFLGLKKAPEALAQFRLALKHEPNMVTTRINIAKVALDYKDFKVAKQEFQRILTIDSNNREAGIGLGIAMRGLGEFESAKSHFEKLSRDHPKDPVPHFWLGELALKNLSDPKTADKEYRSFIELSGADLPSNHPVHKRLEQVDQNLAMERKMAEMQKKMEAEEKRQQARLKELADLRKKLLDEAFENAQKNGKVTPPSKLEGDQLPFVLIPPAVLPSAPTKVRLVGMEFKPVKSVHIGTIKAVWKKIDLITLEMTVPKGLDLGPWDVMITFKDETEDQIVFQGGLWVGKDDKQPAKKIDKTQKKKTGPKGGKKNPGVRKTGQKRKNNRGRS